MLVAPSDIKGCFRAICIATWKCGAETSVCSQYINSNVSRRTVHVESDGGEHIQGFGGEELKERGLLEDPSVDGRVI